MRTLFSTTDLIFFHNSSSSFFVGLNFNYNWIFTFKIFYLAKERRTWRWHLTPSDNIPQIWLTFFQWLINGWYYDIHVDNDFHWIFTGSKLLRDLNISDNLQRVQEVVYSNIDLHVHHTSAIPVCFKYRYRVLLGL